MLRKLLVMSDNTPERLLLVQELEKRLTCEVAALPTPASDAGCVDASLCHETSVILLDTPLRANHAFRVLAQIRQKMPHIPVVVLLHAADILSTAKLLDRGADDVLVRPVTTERLQASLLAQARIFMLKKQWHAALRRKDPQDGFRRFIFQSASMQLALAWARAWTQRGEPVWIDGEEGTGKTMLAQAVAGSPDGSANEPCRIMSAEAVCDALQSGVDFTSPIAGHSLILQNPLNLSYKQLSKLAPALMQRLRQHSIRLVVEQTAERGESPDMHWMAELGIRCRATLPPLCERREDIALLANDFAARYAIAGGRTPVELTPAALAWLESRPWPDNVCGLSHCIAAAVLLAQGGQIGVQELETAYALLCRPLACGGDTMIGLFDSQGRPKSMAQIESEAIGAMLRHENGCMSRASRMLGIGRSTLYRKLGVIEGRNIQFEAG